MKIGAMLALLLIVFFRAGAEETADTIEIKPKYGIYTHYGLNFFNSGFSQLPGVPNCCKNFTGGSGTGFALGFLYEYPMKYLFQIPDSDKVFLSLRAGFSSIDGLIRVEDNTNIIVDGKSQLGTFDHILNSKLSSITFEPAAMYNVYDRLNVFAGFNIGFVMLSQYSQREQITNPPDRGTFMDGRRIQNEFSGEIPDALKFNLGLKAGISYELPLNKKEWLFIAPEVFYTYNITPVVSGLKWNVHTINMGLAFKYIEPPPPPPPPPPPLAPPMPGLPNPDTAPTIAASIKAVEVDSANNEKQDFNIRIEDFVSLNMRPLLTYIFFDKNSSVIPERYKKLKPSETDKFKFKNLQDLNALETYYHVLNIIGNRLRENPNTKLTLIGTNSNTEEEKGNKELSMSRAVAVKDYFVGVWDVNEENIILKARNLPDQPSRKNEPDGADENRRVEIICEDNSITDPVITIDTMRVLSTSNIRFMPKASADAGIKNWKIEVSQEDKDLAQFDGDSYPPAKVDWTLSSKNGSSPKTRGKIEYTLAVEDSLGQKIKTAKKFLPVEQITIERKRSNKQTDKEFEYYSLILFDYGKTNLMREHLQVVDFVKNRLTEGANIYIYGYTDRMGEDKINKRISDQRARTVAKRLKIPNSTYAGIGESQLLYDNGTPEGRFYCRTVTITIETPINDKKENTDE